VWYVARHWWVRRAGKLSHYQLLGYILLALLTVCVVSGLVLTVQGLIGPRLDRVWDTLHLISGLAVPVFLGVHLAMVLVRRINNPLARRDLRLAQGSCLLRTAMVCGVLLASCVAWSALHEPPSVITSFSDDYDWTFGEDRPFAPSLARLEQVRWQGDLNRQVIGALDTKDRSVYRAALRQNQPEGGRIFEQVRRCVEQLELDTDARAEIETILSASAQSMRRRGAIDPSALAGSAGCGTSGCHQEIYEEWLPSAHRYSSLDDMFQRVQTLMASETSPEHTRYCAGCHDPISLFSGAKNASNVTLSAAGAHEGVSCLVCHSVVQADVQGNGDYTIRPARRYAYELAAGRLAKITSDFLIRTYPEHHVASYSRPLYKTPEFCAACHKQYIDTEVNTDIGKVQGQNQYDSWKNSRWHHPDDPDRTVTCRECHMPLVASNDPARGDRVDVNRRPDDGRHRSHRTLASNQYVPVLMGLPGAEEHVRLTERWLRGELDIPEIAHKWTTGPVVRMRIDAPERVSPGEEVSIRVILVNNKTGHDFPTGPLDMIESWVELEVTDDRGNVLYHTGALDEHGRLADTVVWYKADGFDRQGNLIDRHNLWDLVGASYKRALYPGMTDAVETRFQCPSMLRPRLSPSGGRQGPGQREDEWVVPTPPETAGQLRVSAVLWYRKANPEFLDRVYGVDSGRVAPVTAMTRSETMIEVHPSDEAAAE
jgi:hypothetical protein